MRGEGKWGEEVGRRGERRWGGVEGEEGKWGGDAAWG